MRITKFTNLLGALVLSLLPAVTQAQQDASSPPSGQKEDTAPHATPCAPSPGVACGEASARTFTIGLADRDTILILPWFVEGAAKVINERQSLQDYARDIRRGL